MFTLLLQRLHFLCCLVFDLGSVWDAIQPLGPCPRKLPSWTSTFQFSTVTSFYRDVISLSKPGGSKLRSRDHSDQRKPNGLKLPQIWQIYFKKRIVALSRSLTWPIQRLVTFFAFLKLPRSARVLLLPLVLFNHEHLDATKRTLISKRAISRFPMLTSWQVVKSQMALAGAPTSPHLGQRLSSLLRYTVLHY